MMNNGNHLFVICSIPAETHELAMRLATYVALHNTTSPKVINAGIKCSSLIGIRIVQLRVKVGAAKCLSINMYGSSVTIQHTSNY